MTGILSRKAPTFDITSGSFRAAASDLGEVLAYLAGGLTPDAETVSRLGLSLRALQGFLIEEAGQQETREALARYVTLIDSARMPQFRGFDVNWVPEPLGAEAV